MLRSKSLLFPGLTMWLVFGGAAWGQVIATQFNLSTPGARSLGMGGAFLGLADDTTAAYTNPAGLTNLTEGGAQVAVELRHWSYSTPYIAEGRLGGTPNRFGLDLFPGLINVEAESEVSDLSFVSVGYVLPRGLTLSLYKNQLANFATDLETEGWFFDPALHQRGEVNGLCYSVPGNPTCRTYPTGFTTEVKVDSIGAAIAYEVRKPFSSNSERPLSVGIGVARYQLKSFTGTLSFDFNREVSDLTTIDGLFGRSQFLPGLIRSGRLEVGDDSALGLTYGLLWKLGVKGGWAVGGVYREGPEFRTERSDLLSGQKLAGTLKIPDVYGLGVSYSPPRSEGRTKIALDYQRVRYSQRLDDFFAGEPLQGFSIADSQEVHLGVERVVITSGKLVGTVRLGGWRESAHELEYEGNDIPAFQVLYSGGSSDVHWAGGLGLVIGEEYQIDAAVDRSDRVRTLSFSIVRFF